MNIGIFTDTYYPQINGVVTSIRMLEGQLRAMGHKVYIFTVTDPRAEKKLPNVFRLPSMPLSFIPSQRIALLYPPNILFKFKDLKLDIIHTQTEFPLGIFGKLVSGFYRIPIVHTYHTMYVDYTHYIANGHLITPKTAEHYSRIFCNGANAVIVPALKAKECLVSYNVKRPIVTIPSGFDLARFGPEKYPQEEIEGVKRRLGIPPGAPVVVTVSRLAHEKSIDVVIKEMPRLVKDLPDVRYLIVGDGPARNDLQRLASDLGLRDAVIFAGAAPWDEIGKYYRTGDAFVGASTSETQGITYAEAMASKLPVVAKKDESLKELITNDETGFYFEKDTDCAAVLKKVLTDTDRAKKIAERGYASVRRLSSENFARQVEDVYKNCIETKPKKTVYITLAEMVRKAATHVIDTGKK